MLLAPSSCVGPGAGARLAYGARRRPVYTHQPVVSMPARPGPHTTRAHTLRPPSSVVVCAQGRESGGSGFETRSGVMPQAALLKCGRSPLVD
jgi:hypothetical protein